MGKKVANTAGTQTQYMSCFRYGQTFVVTQSHCRPKPFRHGLDLVAIRKDVYENHPFVATSLYDAFVRSKKVALDKMFNLRALRYMTPFLMRDIDEIHEVFNGDPWPYGIEPNRPTLEAFMKYLTDQTLIAAPVPVDDLFVPTYG